MGGFIYVMSNPSFVGDLDPFAGKPRAFGHRRQFSASHVQRQGDETAIGRGLNLIGRQVFGGA